MLFIVFFNSYQTCTELINTALSSEFFAQWGFNVFGRFSPLNSSFSPLPSTNLLNSQTESSTAHYAPLRWPSVLRVQTSWENRLSILIREIKSGFHVIPTLRAGRRCGLIDTNILHLNLRGQVTVGPLALRFFKIQVRMLNHLESQVKYLLSCVHYCEIQSPCV